MFRGCNPSYPRLQPYVSQARLTAAMTPRLPGLEPDEWRRNSHGATLLFAAEGNALFEPICAANAMGATVGEAAGEAEGAELALELAVGCGLAGRVAPRAGAPQPAATLQPPEFRGLEGDSEYALKPFHNLAVRHTLPSYHPSEYALKPFHNLAVHASSLQHP